MQTPSKIWKLIWLFSDEQIGVICQQQCELGYVDCNLACSDSACLIEYTGDTWSLAGNLQADRHAHRAIMNGDRVYVVGGFNGPL